MPAKPRKATGKPTTSGNAARATHSPENPPADGGLCVECFPRGWDGLDADAYAAGCTHGQWHHPQRWAALTGRG